MREEEEKQQQFGAAEMMMRALNHNADMAFVSLAEGVVIQFN